MKIIVTVITDKPRHRPMHTEADVAKAWQFMLDLSCALTCGNESATVEKVEFVEEGE
jgi:hypothetical protein